MPGEGERNPATILLSEATVDDIVTEFRRRGFSALIGYELAITDEADAFQAIYCGGRIRALGMATRVVHMIQRMCDADPEADV